MRTVQELLHSSGFWLFCKGCNIWPSIDIAVFLLAMRDVTECSDGFKPEPRKGPDPFATVDANVMTS